MKVLFLVANLTFQRGHLLAQSSGLARFESVANASPKEVD